jgi:hypothetical protein
MFTGFKKKLPKFVRQDKKWALKSHNPSRSVLCTSQCSVSVIPLQMCHFERTREIFRCLKVIKISPGVYPEALEGVEMTSDG